MTGKGTYTTGKDSDSSNGAGFSVSLDSGTVTTFDHVGRIVPAFIIQTGKLVVAVVVEEEVVGAFERGCSECEPVIRRDHRSLGGMEKKGGQFYCGVNRKVEK